VQIKATVSMSESAGALTIMTIDAKIRIGTRKGKKKKKFYKI